MLASKPTQPLSLNRIVIVCNIITAQANVNQSGRECSTPQLLRRSFKVRVDVLKSNPSAENQPRMKLSVDIGQACGPSCPSRLT